MHPFIYPKRFLKLTKEASRFQGALPRVYPLTSTTTMNVQNVNGRWRRFTLFALLGAGFTDAQYVSRKDALPERLTDIAPPSRNWRRQDQASKSTGIFINSGDDFCIYGPPEPFSSIPAAQGKVVAWCTKTGHNARLIPDGTLQGVTFVKTPNYVQVSGVGDFTKINIQPGDHGGQFDSDTHTPEGAWVSTSSGDAHNWVTLISATTFCFRACTGDPKFCPSNYDTMGCWWVMPGSMDWGGTYQNCESDDGAIPGVYGQSTYSQGANPTPGPVDAPALRGCNPIPSVGNGQSAPPAQSGGSQGTQENHENAPQAPNSSGAPSPAGSGTDSGLSLQSSTGQPSTSWMPTQTCIPCEGAGAAQTGTATQVSKPADSGSPTAPAGSASTAQVGVTQNLLMGAGAGAEGAATITSAPAAASPAAGGDGGFLGKRADEETTTSNGQCCFTTWLPTVVSPAGGATSTAPAGSGNGTKTASATKSGTRSAGPSASGNATRNGTDINSNGTGNGTNGTEEGGARVGMILDGGAWSLLITVGLAGVLSGAGLLL